MQRVIYRYRDTYFNTVCWDLLLLIHWGRVTHIWVGKLTIIGSDNGLDGAKQLSEPMLEHCYLAPLGTNFFSAMLIEIQTFLLKTISSATCQLCRGLNVLRLEIPPWHDFYVCHSRVLPNKRRRLRTSSSIMRPCSTCFKRQKRGHHEGFTNISIHCYVMLPFECKNGVCLLKCDATD